MHINDKQFLGAIYSKYFRSIWGYAYHLTTDVNTADDVTQTVFTRITPHLSRLQELSEIGLKAYLNTVTRNTVYSIYRKEKKIPLISLDNLRGEYEIAEESYTLTEYFHTLSEIERDCVLLRYEYRLSYKEIADMKHPLGTLPRVKSAGIYVLKENRKEGHLYMEPKLYLRQLKILLNHKKSGFQFPLGELKMLANETLKNIEIVYNSKVIYLREDFEAENESAKLVVQRIMSPWHEQKQLLIPAEITSPTVSLSEEQKKLVQQALYYHTFIITGGPGTGKTATLDTFLTYYRKLYGKDKVIALCAPTGRAARRMSIMTGFPAETVHRKFRLFGDIDEFQDFSQQDTGYLEADLVVMDESSMTDMAVFYQVMSRLRPSTKLILVGDPYQLASVQPGHVLNELLKLSMIPSMHLTEIFRQAEGTSIAENAQRVLQGETELTYDNKSFMFLPANSAKIAQEIIKDLYFRACELVGRENVQILSPYKKKGDCSTNRLNRMIQAYYHLESDTLVENTRHSFQAGDWVLQNKNKDGINNGDIGEVIKVTSHTVTVKFHEYKTPKVKVYNQESKKLIELAFALTVHKSQGSQYPIVIMPVLSKQKFMLKRNLFRTAITRAEFRVVLVGQKEAIEYAITHDDTSRRNTLLARRINHYYQQQKESTLWNTEEDLRKSA